MAELSPEEIERRRKEIEAMVAPVMNQADPQGQAIKAEAGRRIENATARGEPVRSSASFGEGSGDSVTAASRATDYPQGQVIMAPPGGSSVDALNRPKSEWGTPAAPQDSAYAQRGLPLGGESTPGASKENPLQGSPLSQQEQAFWAAHPNGAIKDPRTGNLIGLGSTSADKFEQTAQYGTSGQRQGARNEILSGYGSDVASQGKAFDEMSRYGLVEPGSVRPREAPPNFVNIPEVNPALLAQRKQVQNEISTTKTQLQNASSHSSRRQPSQRDTLSQKLHTLTEADNGLGQEHYRQVEEQRKATDQNRDFQDKYTTHLDVMDATRKISQIKSPYGSDEYKKEYFQIVNEQHPNALKDPKFEADAIKTSNFHDERAAARERAIAAGYTVEDTGVGQKGVSQKFVAPAAVSQQQAITKATQKKIGEDFAKSGFTPEQFSQRGAVVGTDKEGKQVPNADATHMKVDIGGHHTLMPVETFNRLNGAYPAANANPAAQGQQAAQPAAAPQGTRVVGGKTYAWNGQRWEPQ